MPDLEWFGENPVLTVLLIPVVVLTLIVAIYAVSGLLSALVVLLVGLAVALLLYALLGRLWDWLRHGKPLLRGDYNVGEGGGGE